MSNALGWYKIFNRMYIENRRAHETNTFEYTLPPSSSIVNQANIMVKAPNNAGKNLTQNIPPPKEKIKAEIIDERGGTEIKPKDICLA
ncbi:hypothetical protein CYCD_22350 [Tenuifilaceae bacterium CYCD]|nr:hypothetical protein CYCD_22350 [Tenuifilaceae bacterium CYCD]